MTHAFLIWSLPIGSWGRGYNIESNIIPYLKGEIHLYMHAIQGRTIALHFFLIFSYCFPDMALQWTFVASFMYVEIGVVIILLLPFVSPGRYV